MLLKKLVIEDNNPNLLPAIAIVLAIVFVAYCIISAKIKEGRKNKQKDSEENSVN